MLRSTSTLMQNNGVKPKSISFSGLQDDKNVCVQQCENCPAGTSRQHGCDVTTRSCPVVSVTSCCENKRNDVTDTSECGSNWRAGESAEEDTTSFYITVRDEKQNDVAMPPSTETPIHHVQVHVTDDIPEVSITPCASESQELSQLMVTSGSTAAQQADGHVSQQLDTAPDGVSIGTSCCASPSSVRKLSHGNNHSSAESLPPLLTSPRSRKPAFEPTNMSRSFKHYSSLAPRRDNLAMRIASDSGIAATSPRRQTSFKMTSHERGTSSPNAFLFAHRPSTILRQSFSRRASITPSLRKLQMRIANMEVSTAWGWWAGE